MTSGGKRNGAGRKPGSANLRTRELADRAAGEGMTPLEYLLTVVRDVDATRAERMEAAKAAAPFIHPRLSSIDMTSDNTHRAVDHFSKEQRDAATAAFARANH